MCFYCDDEGVIITEKEYRQLAIWWNSVVNGNELSNMKKIVEGIKRKYRLEDEEIRKLAEMCYRGLSNETTA